MKNVNAYINNSKDNVATALVLAAVAIATVAAFFNAAPAQANAPVEIVKLDTIVVTAQRDQIVKLDTIVVTASRAAI